MIKKLALRKIADAYSDVADDLVPLKETAATNLIPAIPSYGTSYIGLGLFGGNTGVGGLAAHITKDPKDINAEELKKFKSTTFIPFVGGYRNALRDMYVDDKLSKGDSVHRHALSEYFGTGTSALATALTGSALGAGLGLLHEKDRKGGALAGAVVGGYTGLLSGVIANIIGRAKGLLAKKRTDAEHAKYLEEGLLGNYLVPGKAAYNSARRARMSDNILY